MYFSLQYHLYLVVLNMSKLTVAMNGQYSHLFAILSTKTIMYMYMNTQEVMSDAFQR